MARSDGLTKSTNYFIKAINHGEAYERAARRWLSDCNGSKEEAKRLLGHPYDFVGDNAEMDIKILQTVLALGE